MEVLILVDNELPAASGQIGDLKKLRTLDLGQ
jgi:hypothetical protein